MQFIISNNAANLAAALAPLASTATVEAEYGDAVVKGSVLTLAHHGPRSANPAPCLAENGVAGEGIEAVGLSHLDLDSIGGCAAILGRKPEAPGFWALASFIDTAGPHKLGQAGADPADVARLYAFWAWSQTNRCMPPRDGSVVDVAEQVTLAIEVIARICVDDPELLATGEQFRSAEEALNKRSFVEVVDEVVVRVADVFVNHLYADPSGKAHEAVVSFNTTTGAVTVSLADPIPGVSACEIMQGIFGSEAGGHAGIAGSPRNKRMSLDDLAKTAKATRDAIREAFLLSLEEKGWKKFCFFSEYYGSHPECGEGDKEEEYIFRPGIDAERWGGVCFGHGHSGQNESNDEFDSWLEGLTEGEDYIEI